MLETFFTSIRKQFCSAEPGIEEGVVIAKRLRELLELTTPTPSATDQRRSDSERDM